MGRLKTIISLILLGTRQHLLFLSQTVTDFEIEICPDYLLSSQIQVRLGWKIN